MRLIFLLFLLMGCASVDSDIESFSAVEHPYASVMVVGSGYGLRERDVMETQVANILIEKGVKAYRSLDYTGIDGQITARVFNVADATLIIDAVGRSRSSSLYIPGPSYTTGQVNTFGNSATFSGYTYALPGYSISFPAASYNAKLFDGAKLVWRARIISVGDPVSDGEDFAKSVAKTITKQLAFDGAISE